MAKFLSDEQKMLLATKVLQYDHTATSLPEIARNLKVSQAQVKSIRKTDHYKAALEDAIAFSKRVFQHAVLRDVPPKFKKALEFAEKIMDNPEEDTSARLKAADMLIKASGRGLDIDNKVEEQQDTAVHIHLGNYTKDVKDV